MAAAGAVVGQTLIRRLAALGLWIAQSERGPIARCFPHPSNEEISHRRLVTAALGEVVMTIATQLGGKMVYQYSVCVDRTDRHVFPEPLVPVTSRLWTRE